MVGHVLGSVSSLTLNAELFDKDVYGVFSCKASSQVPVERPGEPCGQQPVIIVDMRDIFTAAKAEYILAALMAYFSIIDKYL
jgi:hypothetical protein